MDSVISLEQVSKNLGDHEILKSISFAVEPGDIFGYLGPNGAGKTTTIKVILGLLKPDSGRAFVMGKDVSEDEARQKVGFVLEADGLYDNLTGYDNLDYYAQIYGVPRAHARSKIKELLERVGLGDRADDKVARYSKGMRQKLALARAMVHDPDLLILDEPTAGVDPSGQIEVREIILDMAHNLGKTIFLSSHNLDEVQRICNRIALIDKGKIKLYGELEKLRREVGRREVIIETVVNPRLDSILAELRALPYIEDCRREGHTIHLTLDTSADTSEIVARLLDSGVKVEEVRKGEATLEEIYAKAVNEEG
ncbi:MAG: ABC transporter ATP-binding protein [Candidatus Methanosuratus sp.]|nr:ABC transporter ATP-binding protein [Candidatus Methanosuratincola sp.]